MSGGGYTFGWFLRRISALVCARSSRCWCRMSLDSAVVAVAAVVPEVGSSVFPTGLWVDVLLHQSSRRSSMPGLPIRVKRGITASSVFVLGGG